MSTSSSVVQYNFPTPIRFGAGALAEVADTLKGCGISRPLVVTDAGVAPLPFMARLAELLSAGGLEAATWSDWQGNPVVSHVDGGVAVYKAHNADGILAVGGGAPVDVAKAIAVMVHHEGHLFDYEDVPGAKPIDGPVPPIVAIPTTAGTGSEVGRSTVISDDETHVKKIIFAPSLLPRVVLADPELLLGLPAGVTAATGFDALTHLVEAFVAKGDHPMCDGIALEGVRLVARHLLPCIEGAKGVAEAGGVDALSDEARADQTFHRGRMLLASMMGAVAFQKGLGVNHSCAHALSTVRDLHHGMANAVVLPWCMAFNAKAVPEAFVRLAQAAECAEATPDAFLDWIVDLKVKAGIPTHLQPLGVTADDVGPLVEVALKDVCHPLGPREVTESDFVALFTDAIGQ